MKKFICLTLSILFLLSCSGLAFAQTERALPEVLPEDIVFFDFSQVEMLADAIGRLQNVSSATVGLTISDTGKASVVADCNTYSKCSISLMAELQQYKNNDWTTIKTFYSSANGTFCVLNGSYSVSSGYSYKVKLTIVADKEIVTVYSNTKTY